MIAASAGLRPPGTNLPTHVEAVAWLAGQVVRIDRLVADPELPTAGRVERRRGRRGVPAGGGARLGARVESGAARTPPSRSSGSSSGSRRAAGGCRAPTPPTSASSTCRSSGPPGSPATWLSPWVVAGGVRRGAVAALLLVLGGVAAVAEPRLRRRDPVLDGRGPQGCPRNARAHGNLGFALAARCRTAEAEAELSRALELAPDYLRAAVNLRLLREGAPLGPGEPRCPQPQAPPP